ncbi:MAG TPA: chromosome segregation protein SMC [Anaerolineaceae bacterium]
MAPRLKSLELHGYKTFASRTVFEYPGLITAIVGPNGSGKSNIADSIRWVLGEQSYSLLRGRKTEDMIFAGSEQRPRAGMASASILFDNSDGWLPIDFAEVAITRRAYRDGTNEYLLNGQRVRLKEISELLAQSGLSERTYTIIGQGLVDAALSLKPEERRKFFEEAAGIGLYRSRREESLNRLETTKRNLERVQDILSELGPRMGSLEKQARRTLEYERIKAELRLLLRDWYGYHWHTTQQDWSHVREVMKAQDIRQQNARQVLDEVQDQLSRLRDQLMEVRERLNGWHTQSAELHRRREKISRDLAVMDERQRALQDQALNLERDANRLNEDRATRQERIKNLVDEKKQLDEELIEAQNQVSSASKTLEACSKERRQVENSLRDTHQKLTASQTRQVQINAHQNEVRQRLESIRSSQKAALLAIENDQNALLKTEAQFTLVNQQREEAQTALNNLETQRSEERIHLDELETRRKAVLEERSGLETQRSRVKAQLEILEQAESSFSGLNQGARFLLEAARDGRLNKGYRPLSQFLEVPAEIEIAITAVLGEFLDGVIFDQKSDLDPALGILENGSKGRAILVPIQLDGEADTKFISSNDKDCLGIAADLVKPPAELETLIRALLGSVFVVRDRTAAQRLIGSLPKSARMVTLKGEVFWGNGVVAAGQEGRAGLISRPRQKRELLENFGKLDEKSALLNQKLKNLDDNLVEKRNQIQQVEKDGKLAGQRLSSFHLLYQQTNLALEQARTRLDWQRKQSAVFDGQIKQSEQEITRMTDEIKVIEGQVASLNDEIRIKSQELAALPLDDLQKEVVHWETTIAVANRSVREAERRITEQSQDLAALGKSIEGVNLRQASFRQNADELLASKLVLRDEETGLNDEIQELQGKITPAEEELEELEKKYSTQQGNHLAAQQAASLADRLANQAQLEVSRLREALDSLQRRVEEDFGLVAFEYEVGVAGPSPLPLEGMVEQLPKIVELPPDLETSINRQRGQLRRMGAVNPEAQKEYLDVKERFEFLTTQVDDLRKADADLRQVIAELDELMKKEFRKTFDAVAAEFRQLFTRMFAGGSARLVMVDEDDLNETGIDIEARLPGRREQGLSLLSGGERSLTAVALVFSLLKVSPTPFCVLDEVDAMLDEANVGRFREMLIELSKNTQFIIITHNRNTVQSADVIYGVTMGRDSASQIISLKLDEVSEEMVK